MFTGNLREATRSLHVTYPVPFVATVLLLCGLSLVGLARAFSGWLMAVLIGFACLMFTVALGVVVWSVFWRPALLRSERYVFLDRMMAVLGDSDMDAAARERLQTTMIGSFGEKHSEKVSRLGQEQRPDAEGDRDL